MEPASEGRGAVSRRLGNWRLRRGPEAAPVTGTPGRLLHSLAGGARSCAASVPSVQPDARLGHEPMRGSGGSGGHGAGRGRRKRRAAAAHGAPPGVLLPAAGAQPFRAADADGRCQAHPGEGEVCDRERPGEGTDLRGSRPWWGAWARAEADAGRGRGSDRGGGSDKRGGSR